MKNKNTQTTKILIGHQETTKPNSEPNWFLRAIVTGLITLGVGIARYYYSHPSDGGNVPNNTNQEQMKKDRAILDKEKG